MTEYLRFELDITGVQALLQKLAQARGNLGKGRRLEEAFDRVAEYVADTARTYAPEWHRTLYSSIDDEVVKDVDEFVAVVFTDKFYAPFLERGVAPYFPNYHSPSFVAWAQDHGFTAYRLAEIISYQGIKERKYFERALSDNSDLILQLIGEAVGRVMEKGY